MQCLFVSLSRRMCWFIWPCLYMSSLICSYLYQGRCYDFWSMGSEPLNRRKTFVFVLVPVQKSWSLKTIPKNWGVRGTISENWWVLLNPSNTCWRRRHWQYRPLRISVTNIVIHVENFIFNRSFVSIRKYVPSSRDDSNNCQFFNLSFIATRASASAPGF